MRSLYSDIFATLEDATFTIPNVTVRKPYDGSPKHYPLIVLHEVANIPNTQATVNGEERTALAYQIDILTRACIDGDDVVLSMWEAGQRLVSEVSDLLDSAFAVTRRSTRTELVAPDVVSTIWRGECVLDSYGYSYRR